jgi:hypothetical protein
VIGRRISLMAHVRKDLTAVGKRPLHELRRPARPVHRGHHPPGDVARPPAAP